MYFRNMGDIPPCRAQAAIPKGMPREGSCCRGNSPGPQTWVPPHLPKAGTQSELVGQGQTSFLASIPLPRGTQCALDCKIGKGKTHLPSLPSPSTKGVLLEVPGTHRTAPMLPAGGVKGCDAPKMATVSSVVSFMGGHAMEELVIQPFLPSLSRSWLQSKQGRVPKGYGKSPVPPRADRDTDTGPAGLGAAALKPREAT